ncbi:hypothetical protein O181_079967 [Austropuccinia psidii MF-1]|uniref:Uncharacterized protein n=1 Tax=Austropuccinia psidii MF-1 TaxID=1389203 RepID=A0A9Q3IH12_9BASI|nr:hypothetical protein [Austropuccinia psidii MF-1]
MEPMQLKWNLVVNEKIHTPHFQSACKFPVSLINPYQPADKEFFPLRNPTPLTVPPVEQSEDKNINKVIKERRLRGKNQREYLVRYRNPVHEDECLGESEIPESDKFLRRFRHERRPQA